ncbi:MAG TPA: branched-chain amino acid ABC transporter permease [Acidimicrobiales bacterium]|jgi:branched-chain amino acid transport system permease protein
MQWVNAVVQGILLGGLYALLATGLSLAFGVMRLVNLAHGDLAILFAYLTVSITDAIGWNPLLSLLVVLPLAFVAGWLLQVLLYDRIVGVDPAYQIVATFGLAIVIQNVLLEQYSANTRRLDIGSFDEKSIRITNQLSIGWFPLITFVVAVAVLGALSLFIARTRLGRAIRATSDDPDAAELMGIAHKRIYALALAIALATVALAGVFIGVRTQFDPAAGPASLIFAFEAVIIGGLGSVWGTLAGGLVLGVAQTVGAQAQPGWGILVGHIVFLAVLAFKPTGLFGKATA